MNALKSWVMCNPKQSAAIAVSAVPVLAPGLIALPLLGVIGFGPLGPVAGKSFSHCCSHCCLSFLHKEYHMETRANSVNTGSAAAALQAGVGNVVAPSAFAIMQSAAMGGYGLGLVNGVVQASTIVVATTAAVFGVGGGSGGSGSK
jgi:hypothetical protein